MATLNNNWQMLDQKYLGNSNGTLNWYIRIYGKLNSQDKNSNTSSVSYESRIYAEGSGSYIYTGSTTTKTISGTNLQPSSEDASGTYYKGETALQTRTVTIQHNNEGYASITASGSFYSSPWGFNNTATGSADLPQIKRQAIITSATNFNDEQNPTIQYTNPNGNNVSSLQACISLTGATDDISYRNISKTGSSYTFNLTNEERELLRNATPNSNTLTVYFFIRTVLSGNTLYNNVQRTMTIVNGNPIFSDFDYDDIDPTTLALTGNSKYNINGYSTIRVSISTLNKATALKGATMSKYQFIIGNSTREVPYSDSEEVYVDIPNSSIGEYKLYAIDSRGNSTLVTKLAERNIDYTPLYIDYQSSNVQRDDGGVGDSVTLTYKGNIWNDSFGSVSNGITLSKYEFKKSDEDDTHYITGTTNITPTITNNVLNFTGLIRSNASDYSFDVQKSYVFRLTLQDELSTYIITLSPLPSGVPNISLNRNGVGIMCDYDESLGGDLQISGSVFNLSNLSKIGKTLWTGRFTSGSITVPEIDNYTVILVLIENTLWCLGTRYYGLGGVGSYASYGREIFSYRLGGTGSTMTIDNLNKGGSNGSINQAITKIVGLI